MFRPLNERPDDKRAMRALLEGLERKGEIPLYSIPAGEPSIVARTWERGWRDTTGAFHFGSPPQSLRPSSGKVVSSREPETLWRSARVMRAVKGGLDSQTAKPEPTKPPRLVRERSTEERLALAP